MCSVTEVVWVFVLVTDKWKQFTLHINYRRHQKSTKERKYIHMNNKCIKGWQNIDKLCAEYTCKQIIQKCRTELECLKSIVYISCRRRCKAVFLSKRVKLVY